MNRFRCQYQKGEHTYVSEVIESENPISSSQIILALAALAIKVKNKCGTNKGGRVALQVLKIHEYVIKNIHGEKCHNTGCSKSYYLDKRSKNKLNRCERVDIEFYGDYGREDDGHILNTYILKYRKMKNWFKKTNNLYL